MLPLGKSQDSKRAAAEGTGTARGSSTSSGKHVPVKNSIYIDECPWPRGHGRVHCLGAPPAWSLAAPRGTLIRRPTLPQPGYLARVLLLAGLFI